MRKNKQMMICIIAMTLTVFLFGGCNKKSGKTEKPEYQPSGVSDTTEKQEKVEKPLLDSPEKITSLEAALMEKFDSIEKVEITQQDTEYHVKLTLTSPDQAENNELLDSVISYIMLSYGQLTEEQIVIEIAE